MTTREAQRDEARTDLEARIVMAHKSGDTETLRSLQTEYRSSGFAVTRPSPEAPTLVESGRQRSRSGAAQLAVARRRPPKAITRNSPASTSRIASDRRLVFRGDTLAELRRDELHWLGVECGGGLFGTREDNGIVYVRALGRTRTDWRAGTVRLPWRELVEDGAHFRSGTNWRLVGDWHSEPYHDDGIYGSGADRQAWKQLAYLNGGHYVGVVMSPRSTSLERGDDWTLPVLNAWLATPDDIKRLPLDYKFRLDD